MVHAVHLGENTSMKFLIHIIDFALNSLKMSGYKRLRSGLSAWARSVMRPRYRSSVYSGKRAARVLRSIGAPSRIHTFSRPGNRLLITNDGNNYYVNGSSVYGSTSITGAYNVIGQQGLAIGAINNSVIRGCKDWGLSEVFQFSFLTAFADLAGLYDNYRIKKVTLKVDLSFNNAPGVNTDTSVGQITFGTNSLPLLHYCVDQDDNTAPQAANDVLQYSKSRSVRLGERPVYISLVPRAQGVVNATTGSSATNTALGSMIPAGTWLDTTNGATVPHFGLKMFFENFPIGTNSAPGSGVGQWNWCMTFTPVYTLECKNVS